VSACVLIALLNLVQKSHHGGSIKLPWRVYVWENNWNVYEVSEIDVNYLYFMDISVEDSALKFRFIVRHFSLYRMKLIFIDLLSYNLFTCLSLLIIYHIHLNCPRIVLNIFY
jgi:hypothetical protein